MTRERPELQPPIVLSMVLADGIHKDRFTGKHYILGTYSAILADKFPHQVGLWVYITLTDTRGPTALRVRVIDADERHGPLHETANTFDLPDPNRVSEIVFSATVAFPQPGDYRIQLYGADELLRELPVQVLQHSGPLPGRKS